MQQNLFNTHNKKTLKAEAHQKSEKRYTLSFYRYLNVENPQAFRDDLYMSWENLGVLGRIYVASEGINAQLSIPETNYDLLEKPELNWEKK